MITKHLLAILICSVVLNAQIQSVVDKLDSLVNDLYFESTLVSISAYDLSEDRPIYSHNERYLLHPASNMKIITSAAALYFLGEDYEFTTKMFHTGSIEDSILKGDIYIAGGFDPDFTDRDLDSMVSELRYHGIHKIEGNIYGDVSNTDSLYWGNGWMWDDDPEIDFPYMTSLIINDAAIEIVYRPGAIGQKAFIEIYPRSDFYSFSNGLLTSGDTSDFRITRDWMGRNNNIVATGVISYLEEEDTIGVNLINTTDYFLTLFKEKLREGNIEFMGEPDTLSLPDSAQHIFSFSRRLGEVLINLNKESDNLSAEMALRALALENFGKPASAVNGIKMIDSLITLIGLKPENYRLVDGSGVSHYNLVTSDLLLEILKFFYYNENDLFELLYNSFPVGGIDGTLETRMKSGPSFNNVHAKTGTLSGVSSLSGYLTARNGNLIAFSVIMQNYLDSNNTARDYQDRICDILCGIE